MKNQNTLLPGGEEALETRFGLRVAVHLNDAAGQLPHDLSERLKSAREQALQRAKLVRSAQIATSPKLVTRGSVAALALGGGGPRSDWWIKFASFVPVLALIGGFALISDVHTNAQIKAAAEIDAALLADDAPLAAYSDPGFVEFLKVPRD